MENLGRSEIPGFRVIFVHTETQAFQKAPFHALSEPYPFRVYDVCSNLTRGLLVRSGDIGSKQPQGIAVLLLLVVVGFPAASRHFWAVDGGG